MRVRDCISSVISEYNHGYKEAPKLLEKGFGMGAFGTFTILASKEMLKSGGTAATIGGLAAILLSNPLTPKDRPIESFCDQDIIRYLSSKGVKEETIKAMAVASNILGGAGYTFMLSHNPILTLAVTNITILAQPTFYTVPYVSDQIRKIFEGHLAIGPLTAQAVNFMGYRIAEIIGSNLGKLRPVKVLTGACTAVSYIASNVFKAATKCLIKKEIVESENDAEIRDYELRGLRRRS